MTDAELRELHAHITREIAALVESQKRTDEQIAKTDAQLTEQLAKTDAKLTEQLAKTDAQLAKTDAQLAKTDAKLNKLAEMYGGVGNNQGAVAEAFYFNSLSANPVLNGIRFDFVEKNVTRSLHGLTDEFDIVMVNGSELYLIEVKYKAHPKDLERLLHKKAVNFRKLYPAYEHYRQHLGLASFSFDDDLIEEALSNGVTVLQRRGDIIETIAP